MPLEAAVDEYPSIAWVIVPLLLIPLSFVVRAYLAARRLSRTGVGRDAPGFQTNVRRVAVTPEIAARLRRGEHVSPEEITAAQAEAEALMAIRKLSGPRREEIVGKAPATGVEPDQLLPDQLTRRARKTGTRAQKDRKR